MFRCNLVKYKGTQCESSIYLLAHKTDFQCSLFRTNNNHTHDDNLRNVRVDSNVKPFIKELLNKNVKKPKDIQDAIILTEKLICQ